MQDLYKQTRLFQTTQTALNLNEAVELIDASEKLFQEKLSQIKNILEQETDTEKQEKLVEDANLLYLDYQKSLAAIKEFIDRDIFENI
jgi:hypothetical protein